MLPRILVTLFLGAALALQSPVAIAAGQAPTFRTEADAQKHCPVDIVVWLNLPTGVYHFKGQRWYGATKSGVYVCKDEADAAGDHATRNGQ